MNQLRARLRDATAPLHERVDRAFSAFALEHTEGYRHFLAAHAEVTVPLEQTLEAAGIQTLLPDWPQRCRRQALLADLQDLGAPATAVIAPGEISTPGWCWGAVYVMEGSRLGGRVLAKRVAQANPNAPLRYLGQQNVAPSWPGFLEHFERNASGCPWNEVLEGAQSVFERFIRAAEARRERLLPA